MFDTTDALNSSNPAEIRVLNDDELNEVSGGLIWLAAALVAFAVGAAIGAVTR